MIKSNGNKAVVAVIVVIAVISGVYLFMDNHEKKNVIVSESTAEVQEESPVDLEEKRLQEYVGKSVESILPEAWKVLNSKEVKGNSLAILTHKCPQCVDFIKDTFDNKKSVGYFFYPEDKEIINEALPFLSADLINHIERNAFSELIQFVPTVIIYDEEGIITKITVAESKYEMIGDLLK